MKKLFFTAIFALIISITSLSGQERTDYSIEFVDGIYTPISNLSSSYWFGHNYVFYVEGTDYKPQLCVSVLKLQDDHVVSPAWFDCLKIFESGDVVSMVSSCTFKKDLYVFYYMQQTGNNTELNYLVSKVGLWFQDGPAISLDRTITSQISTVVYNDTIYMFFVDDADSIVKYYSLVYSETQSQLVLVNETPAIVDSEINNCIGTVAAITFVNKNLEEEILIATPTSYVVVYTNKTALYRGKPGAFYHFDDIYSVQDHHIKNISMAQGSVKGGSTGNYNIQFGYTFSGDNQGLARCEYNIQNGFSWEWEQLEHNNIFLIGDYTWYMEFYSKSSTKRQKYLLQGYVCGDGARGAMWESDKLEYADKTEEVAPVSHAKDFLDLVLVAEGAPPYTLNGYKLSDPVFDPDPPSTFEYVVSNENSISTLTTYSLGVEANMGLGPVTAGFKDSFMESSGTTVTETTTITQQIIPPKIDTDSAGLMWYYYVAPTVERERWIMKDYDGNAIEPNRNLFFFKLNSPQMLNLSYKLDYFGTHSPRAYDLESYKLRDVQNIAGIDVIKHISGVVDFGGSSPTINVDFSESHTIKHDESFEVSVGIDANYGIFSASASLTASLKYERERTTTCEKGFQIDWSLFAAKNPEDTTNVRRFVPEVFIAKTTDSTAYFLLEEFKHYKPFFITYEVGSITYGDFLDPPYYIGENPDIISKYNFLNYPNPCTDKSKFAYQLPDKSHVSLTVYNTYGQTVNIPLNEIQSPGQHEYELSTFNLPAGIYYYRMLIDEDLIMGKIIKN